MKFHITVPLAHLDPHEEIAMTPVESVTLMVKVELPAVVGVPVIAPVMVFNIRPAGRDPDAIENVYPGTPPAATAAEL